MTSLLCLQVISPSNSMYIEFRSDHSQQRQGFAATFEFITVDEGALTDRRVPVPVFLVRHRMLWCVVPYKRYLAFKLLRRRRAPILKKHAIAWCTCTMYCMFSSLWSLCNNVSCVKLRHFADRNVYNSDSPVEPVHPPNKSLVDPVLVIPPGQAGQQNFWHLSLTAVVLVKGD